MAKDYEMEELADEGIKDIRDFLDVEGQALDAEHELLGKMQSWDYVFGHLDERIPASAKKVHELNRKIIEKFLVMRGLVESGRLKNLSLVDEQKSILAKLPADVEHRDWRAVRDDLESDEGKELGAVRLSEVELSHIHGHFLDLMRIMKTGNLVKALKEDLTEAKEKEEYKKAEEFYFVQIYKFARAYERIFRHLWRKERRLLGKTIKVAEKAKKKK